MFSTMCFVLGAKSAKCLEVDPIEWKYVVPYSYYIVGFALGVYCNMKSLTESNVETVIVFKALSPCIISIADVIFLGREYPSLRSWFALGLIAFGAFGYASYDEKFQTQGISAYTWPILYLFTISFEMTYGKKIVGTVDLKTRSGPVLYVNLLGLAPMLCFAAVGNEHVKFLNDRVEGINPINFAAAFVMVLGCIAGTGIGYSSWWCREMVSAASFSIVGIMNKCLTIMLNLLVWDNHANSGGIICLGLCLVGGTIYQQAPMRGKDTLPKYAKLENEPSLSDDEQKSKA